MSTPTTLHVFYKGTKQTIKFYPSTKKKDILKMIFKLFYLSESHSWTQLKANYMFQDDDGDVVMFDPASIPDNTRLCLCFIDELLGLNKDDPVPWKWDNKWNNEHCGYKLSFDGRVIECGNTPENGGSMPILISNRFFTSGKHEWTVVWRREMTYHAAGLVSHENVNQPRLLKNYGSKFGNAPLFTATGNMGKKQVHIQLDMDKREALINGVKHYGLPEKVYAGICFKMPHQMHATLLFDE